MPSAAAPSAVRWTSALVEPPIACSTRQRVARTRRSVMISLGRRALLFAISAARLPVASAMRRRSAVRRRDRAAAGQRHAQRLDDAAPWCWRCPSPCRCPSVGASRSLTISISASSIVPARYCAPQAAAVGAGAEHLALVVADQHRPDRQHDRGHVGAGRAPSAAPAGSCRSRRSAPPRPSAGRGSSPRCPSTSGCAGTCWSDARSSRGSRWSGTPSAAPPASMTPRFTASISCGTLPWQGL